MGDFVIYATGVGLILWIFFQTVRIVPQREQYVVENLGKYQKTLSAGFHILIPFVQKVAYKHTLKEQTIDVPSQSCITADNISVEIDGILYLQVQDPYLASYGIQDYHYATSQLAQTTLRSEIGKMELDEVQSNRTQLISQIKKLVESAVNDWGIEVTRAELLDVNLDQATRDAMLQQLNAERARRAQVTEAEGAKRAVELGADAELYAAEQIAKARRIAADAEAYATGVVAAAIADNGMAAAQYQVALKQVEALTALGSSAGSQTVVVPSSAMDAFGDAFKMLKGVSK